ncbi:MAG: ABC transporter substrate-binding protein [Methylobacteriaceae bacterium]|nr:ABC transporter substrate-binding protein [Methylobacteriaceae bacterium]
MWTFLRRVAAAAAAFAALASSARAFEVTVGHYGSLVQGAPYAIALEKGFFKEAGLDLTRIVSGDGGGTTVRSVLASPFPFGEAALGAVLNAQQRGLDLVMVSAAVSGPVDMFWLVRPDSPIRSVTDLRGRKVGYTNPKSGSDYLLRMVLDKAGVTPEAVELIATGGMREGLAMLSAGQIDVMPVVEPVLATLGDKFRPVFAAGDYLPSITQTVGFTSRDFARTGGDKLRALLAARRKAVDFIYEKPDEAADIVARSHGLTPAIARAVMQRFARDRYWSRGDFDQAAMDVQLAGLRLVGAVDDKGPNWTTLIDARFLPADLPRPGM